MCQRIVSGIEAVKRRHLKSVAAHAAVSLGREPTTETGGADDRQGAYPSVATSSDGPEGGRPAPAAAASTCDACRWSRVRTDPSHTRVRGECRYPDVEPIVWSCDGCASNRPRGHGTHTLQPGECRLAQVRQRRSGPRRQYRTRSPRPGRVPVHSEPTARKYQKYLSQKCSLEAALTVHRRLRIRAEPQPSQHPSASLGQLATLEVLQHRHPSASLGQTELRDVHANLGQRWRKRAPRRHARQTGVVLTSSQYFEDSAQPLRLASAACYDDFIFGGGTLVPPRCSGR